MNFYQKLKYLPEDLEPTKLLPILILTHLFLLQQSSKTFEFQGEQLKVSQEISNLEKEIKKLLGNPKLKVSKIKFLSLLEKDYPEIAQLLQIRENFDLQVAVTFFENGLLPWWWEVDPLLLTLLKDLVFKRAVDPQKWIEVSDVLLEKKRGPEAILALEEALWQSTGDTSEIEDSLARIIDVLFNLSKKDSLVNLYHDIFSKLEALDRGSYRDHPKIIKEIYRILKTSKLRKKTKWLLWERVLRKINDPIEFERQREEILAELSLNGLESYETPRFITECLSADASQKQSLNENASILGEIQEFLITSSAETSGKESEFLVGTIGLIDAKEGNLERALSLVEKYKSTNTAFSNFKLAAILDEAGEKEEALLLFEKAWNQFSEKPRETQAKSGPGVNPVSKKLIISHLKTMSLMTNSTNLQDKFLKIISELPNYLQTISLIPNELFAKVFSGKFEQVLSLINPESLLSLVSNGPILDSYFEKIEICLREADEKRSSELSEAALELFSKSVVTNEVWEFIFRFLPSFLFHVDNSWEWIELLSKNCAGAKSPCPESKGSYEKILIKICGIQALAKKRDTDSGKKKFEELLEQIWEMGSKHQTPSIVPCVMRSIMNLVRVLPDFGDILWGFEMIQVVNRKLKEFIEGRKAPTLFIAATSTAIMMAASKLSDTQSALTVIEDNLQYMLNYLETSQESNKDILYDAINTSIRLISEMGDSNGLLIIENLEEKTQKYYEEKLKEKEKSGQIYYVEQTCLECIFALLAHGKEAGREKLEELLEKAQKRGNIQDLMDFINNITKNIKKLTHEDRLWLVGRILQVLRSRSFPGYGTEIVKNLIMTLAEENATYLRNLEIWKNQEERSIIDRVLSFGV